MSKPCLSFLIVNLITYQIATWLHKMLTMARWICLNLLCGCKRTRKSQAWYWFVQSIFYYYWRRLAAWHRRTPKNMRKCTSMALPMILQGKGKNAECETWRHLGVPKFSTNVAKRTERTQMGQFLGDLLGIFWRKNDDVGGSGAALHQFGAGSRNWHPKKPFWRERG